MDILIDYLAFTSKVHGVPEVKEMLGLSAVAFVDGKPRNGWTKCDFIQGIRIYYGGREDVAAEISGVGCRLIESLSPGFDWVSFFDLLLTFGHDINVSRLDVACDEKEGILNFEKMVKHAREDRYISRAKSKRWIDGDEQSVIFGSPSSSTRLRIYNKALERGVEGHWVRAEFQFRDEAADSFMLNLHEVRHVGRTYTGVLNNYLRFIKEPVKSLCEHYGAATVTSWWSRFVGTSEKLPNVCAGGLEYNLMDAEDFLQRQASSSMRLLMEYYDGDLSKILGMMEQANLSKKQQLIMMNKGGWFD